MKKEIVDQYSWVNTVDMCMEEAGELVHALNKYKRAHQFGYPTGTSKKNAHIDLIQSIADAQNAIKSVMYALNIEKKDVDKEVEKADEQIKMALETDAYFNKNKQKEVFYPEKYTTKSEKTPEKQAKNEFYSKKCVIKNNNAYPETYWIDENNHNAVNHPSHYCTGGIECIDVIKATSQGMNGIEAFCHGNAMKYLFRWKQKNGVEDLKKAKWYLDRLIKAEEGNDNKK